MAGFSRSVEDMILDWFGGTPAASPPSGLYLAVYTVLVDDQGAGGTEQTTSGFSRQLFTLAAKATDTDGKRFRPASATVTLGPNTGSSPVGPLVGWAVWSVASGGTAAQLLGSDLFRDPVTGDPVTKTVQPGDRLDIPAGALKIKVS